MIHKTSISISVELCHAHSLIILVNTFPAVIEQSTVTRNKNLVAHGQKKAIAGRKGKRLGGVVKRAMKAAAPKKK